MARILITRIAGFIGPEFAKYLYSDGHQVTGVDNYNNYYDSKLKFLGYKSNKLDALDTPQHLISLFSNEY